MSNKSSFNLTSIDFSSNKEALKEYLREQEEFKDYDFDGSNMSTLLDILSYNTHLNSFYLNMVANEMFLDSAQLRDSVISHAKELNYLPRSFSSSVAKLNVSITTSDPSKKNILIPKGTAFLSRVGDDTFSFVTNENVIVKNVDNVFNTELSVYEGTYISDTYAINYSKPLRYKLNNNTIDLSSVSVTVIEDNGATQTQYKRATSLLGLDETREVFFIQPTTNGEYEIMFGDGIISKMPKNNSIVLVEYRICAGELPNGAQRFIASGRIDGEANIAISTIVPASFGAVAETVESIKYNAPRAFATQERAITTEDYENILKINFPEINAVVAYGGEDATPPQYGRIFISVDLKEVDDLPQNKKSEYVKFLKTRSSVAMEPIFISPEYLYMDVRSIVRYNINQTSLNPEDIRTLITSSILTHSNQFLNNFNRTFRYSRLVNDIDDADLSIISNDTEIRLIKYLNPLLNTNQSFNLDFKAKLKTTPPISNEHIASESHSISSSTFTYFGQNNCIIEDDGAGVVRIVAQDNESHKAIINIGSVDYLTGVVSITNLNISNIAGSELKIYATTDIRDITAQQNVIFNILEQDINLDIEQTRE